MSDNNRQQQQQITSSNSSTSRQANATPAESSSGNVGTSSNDRQINYCPTRSSTACQQTSNTTGASTSSSRYTAERGNSIAGNSRQQSADQSPTSNKHAQSSKTRHQQQQQQQQQDHQQCDNSSQANRNNNQGSNASVHYSSYLSSKKSRIRITDLQEAKNLKQKWPMLTAYDFVSARIFEKARIPCLLVGDSAAQIVFGRSSTVSTQVDELIYLSKAVSNNANWCLVISDLPFGSYRESPKQALRTATRFLKEANVSGVKLEGGREIAQHVEVLTKAGIPVMAHIGFTPQSENTLGGFKIQARNDAAVQELLEDALALERAGAFACVIELVPSNVGKALTDALKIPVIGIGAGPDCDAQILVWADMAGYVPPTDGARYLQDNLESGPSLQVKRVPKFVKQYANLSNELFKATLNYANEVCSGAFPAAENCYDS